MRIALLTYRGNMYCGGQGIYAAYLAREWKKAGHEVHVIAGPPLPELPADIPLHVVPNENVFGLPLKDWARQKDARNLLSPVNLWELGVSRIGVFPEMQTFGLRLMLPLARDAREATPLRRGLRQPVPLLGAAGDPARWACPSSR